MVVGYEPWRKKSEDVRYIIVYERISAQRESYTSTSQIVSALSLLSSAEWVNPQGWHHIKHKLKDSASEELGHPPQPKGVEGRV